MLTLCSGVATRVGRCHTEVTPVMCSHRAAIIRPGHGGCTMRLCRGHEMGQTDAVDDRDTPRARAGEIVRRERRRLKMTQPELAQLAGVAEVTVRRLEQGKGRADARPYGWAEIAGVLGLPSDAWDEIVAGRDPGAAAGGESPDAMRSMHMPPAVRDTFATGEVQDWGLLHPVEITDEDSGDVIVVAMVRSDPDRPLTREEKRAALRRWAETKRRIQAAIERPDRS